MPDQPDVIAEFDELRASARNSLSALRQLRTELLETIEKSRTTIAESTALIGYLNKLSSW